MPLSASVLSAAIRTNLLPKSWIVDNEHLTELCDAIAGAVVDHITSAAIIPAGIAVSVACPPGGGTGTGATTGPGSIT